jgi:hypothetical protein
MLVVIVAVASAASTDILDAYAVALRSRMFLYYLIATCFLHSFYLGRMSSDVTMLQL